MMSRGGPVELGMIALRVDATIVASAGAVHRKAE